MGTLYLDRKDLHLSLESRRLVIREPDKKPQGIPLTLLERVVVHGRVALDSVLLGALAERGVSVVFLSGRHSRRTALVFGAGHNDAGRRLGQYRAYQDPELRLNWSRLLITGKLQGQRRLLAEALERRPDRRKSLKDGLDRLDGLLISLTEAGNLDVLRGLEGSAAAGYFAALTALFPPSLNFTGRNRRPPRDPVNACLSLGYTLLHTEAVRACWSAGLDPLIGFFHDPAYGRESLACDLVEPLRPRLDGWAWELFSSRALRGEQFAEDKGACLMNKAGRQTFFACYEIAARPWRRYLRQQSYYLARELSKLAPTWPVAEES